MKEKEILEQTIRAVISREDYTSNIDLANNVIKALELYDYMHQQITYLNKYELELIKSGALDFFKNSSILYWVGSPGTPNVSNDDMRTVSIVRSTINYLISQGFLDKIVKVNVEDDRR